MGEKRSRAFGMKRKVLISAMTKIIEKLSQNTDTRIPNLPFDGWKKLILELFKKAMEGRISGMEMTKQKDFIFKSLRGFKRFLEELTNIVQTRCDWSHQGHFATRGHARGSALKVETGEDESETTCFIVPISRKKAATHSGWCFLFSLTSWNSSTLPPEKKISDGVDSKKMKLEDEMLSIQTPEVSNPTSREVKKKRVSFADQGEWLFYWFWGVVV